MPLHVSSTMWGSKLYYTASGIIIPVGGRPVHMGSSLNLSTGRPPTGVIIPDAV